MPSKGQFTFEAGEWAPEYWGRADKQDYLAGLRRARNFVVMPAGSATKRPGFRYVAGAAAGAAVPVRLRRFSPSLGTNYQLEFGPGYVRFYRQRAQIKSAGVAYQLATPYTATTDAALLSFAQNNNTLYIFHRNYPVQILTWGGSDTGFSLAAATMSEGPYLPIVANSTTLSPSSGSAGGAISTLTASATTAINGDAGFQASDVGRPIRVQQVAQQLSSVTVAAGGGYLVGDTITIAGGVYIRPAVLAVAAVGGGGLPEVQIVDPGAYLSLPAQPVAQLETSGAGTGFSAGVAFLQPPFALSSAGANTQQMVWCWGTITAVASTTAITVSLGFSMFDAQGDLVQGKITGDASAGVTINAWQLGAWCAVEGYPGAGAFFQGRLLAGGTKNQPKTFWGSDVTTMGGIGAGQYGCWQPSLATGQVIASNGTSYQLNDEEADPISAFSDCGKAQIPALGIFSGDSEFVNWAGAQPSSPVSVNIYRDTRYTNAPIQPLRVGRETIFIDKSRQRLRVWQYTFMAGGFIGREPRPEMRHLLLPGVAAFDYALMPHPILWLALQDGSLAGLTWQSDEGPIAAPHSHTLGGSYYGAPPFVTALSISLSEDAIPYSEVWVAVMRADPGGGATQTIEVMTPYFRQMPVDQAVFVDCAVSSALSFPAALCTPAYGPFQPSGNALPQPGDLASFTFSGDVAGAGDLVTGTVLRINGGAFLLAAGNGSAVLGATQIVAECMVAPTSLQPRPATAWSYTAMATSFAGFSALDGRSVAVLADGAWLPSQIVANGTLTLPAPASYVTAGLAYGDTKLITLDFDLPAIDGTSLLKDGRLDHLYLRFFETVGGRFGQLVDDADADEPDDLPMQLEDIEPPPSNQLADWAPPLRSQDLRLALPGGASMRRAAVIESNNPWPMTLTAIVVRGGVGASEVNPR